MTRSKNKNEEILDKFINWVRKTDENIQRMHKYGISLESNVHLPRQLKARLIEGLNKKCNNVNMYISIKDYLNPTTLAQCWIVSIIDHNILTGKWALVELDRQYLDPTRLLKLIFHSRYDAEDHQYFSITQQNLKCALDKLITPFINDYNALVNRGYILGHELDMADIKRKLDVAIEMNVKHVVEPLGDKINHRLMLSSDVQLIESIKSLTSALIRFNLLHIYTGYAGSGKSTRAICDIPSFDCISVTRSNTVGMSLDTKYRKIHSDSSFIPKSITAYNISNAYNINKPHGVNVIIDEFSQWELHDLETFESILSKANAFNKHVYILGDTLQMKGFISRGSLLEPYIQLYKACGGVVIECNELHRCEDLNYNGRVLQYIQSGDTNYLSEYIRAGSFGDITEDDFERIISNGVILTDCGDSDKMFNNGRGCKYANHLVINYLAKQNGINYESVNDALAELTKIGLRINLLANDTCIMNSDAYKNSESERERMDYKLLRNERAELYYKHGGYVVMLKRRTADDAKYISWTFDSVDDAMEHFALGYAITVTRAQGLEWDNVIYVQDSYYGTTYEEFYVAMTRCKQTSKCLVNKPLKRMHPESIASHFSVRSLDE